jgi:hypothetical protein
VRSSRRNCGRRFSAIAALLPLWIRPLSAVRVQHRSNLPGIGGALRRLLAEAPPRLQPLGFS